jgi:hypothetical protein
MSLIRGLLRRPFIAIATVLAFSCFKTDAKWGVMSKEDAADAIHQLSSFT